MVELKIAILTPENAVQVGQKTPIKQLASAMLKETLVLWERWSNGRDFPPREDIELRAMSAYLRYTTLYSISAATEDFECRIMGDAAVVAWGRCFAGMRRVDFNSYRHGMGDVLWNVFRSVALNRQPLVLRGKLWKDEYEITDQETLFLPLGPDDRIVDFILSVGSYQLVDPLART